MSMFVILDESRVRNILFSTLSKSGILGSFLQAMKKDMRIFVETAYPFWV